jgi:hypothetical protein
MEKYVTSFCSIQNQFSKRKKNHLMCVGRWYRNDEISIEMQKCIQKYFRSKLKNILFEKLIYIRDISLLRMSCYSITKNERIFHIKMHIFSLYAVAIDSLIFATSAYMQQQWREENICLWHTSLVYVYALEILYPCYTFFQLFVISHSVQHKK